MKNLITHLLSLILLFQTSWSILASDQMLQNQAILEQAKKTQAGYSSNSTPSSNQSNDTENVSKIKGNDIDPKSGMIMSNIALFAASLSAPVLAMQCPKEISTWIFVAASGLYIANEIGLITMFNKASDKAMEAFLGRGDEDKQIDSLEEAAAQTERSKNAALRRSIVAKIAAAGFLAASAMAVYENFKDMKGGICGVTASHSQQIDNYLFTKVNIALPFDYKFYVENTTTSTETILAYKDSLRYYNGETQSSSIEDYENLNDQLQWQEEKNDFSLKNLLAQSIELFIPKAMANDSKGNQLDWNSNTVKLGTFALGAASGLAITTVAKQYISTQFMRRAYTRAIGFGAIGTLAFAASSSATKAAQTLEQRQHEYNRLANQLRTQSQQKITTKGGSEQQLGSSTQRLNKDLGKIENNSLCFTGNKGQLDTDNNCTCAQRGTCKQPEVPNITNLPDFSGKPLFADSLGSLKDAGSSIYSGNLQKAKSAASSLGKNAARISKLRDAMVKKLNEENKANGGSTLNLAAAENKFKDAMIDKVDRAFSNLSDAEKGKLSAFASGFGSAINDDKESEGTEKGAGKTDPLALSNGKSNIQASGNSAKAAPKGNTWDFNFDDDNKEKTADELALAEAKSHEDSEYVIDGDISEDRNKDIFNIITKRYLKSAYPVIFE